MNQPATTRATFLAGIAASAFACSAVASNDINKCLDAAGLITLTDEPCPSGSQTLKVIAGSEAAQGATVYAVATPERFSVSRLPPRNVTLMKSSKPARGLALDVATLRTARLNMHLLDNAAQVLRSQRLAGLQ